MSSVSVCRLTVRNWKQNSNYLYVFTCLANKSAADRAQPLQETILFTWKTLYKFLTWMFDHTLQKKWDTCQEWKLLTMSLCSCVLIYPSANFCVWSLTLDQQSPVSSYLNPSKLNAHWAFLPDCVHKCGADMRLQWPITFAPNQSSSILESKWTFESNLK